MAYRILKEPKYLVIHTTASPQKLSWQWVRNYFINVLKWSVEGYHVVIQADGKVKRLVDNAYQSNGVRRFVGKDIAISNANSFNISWIGGITKTGKGIDNRTEKQKEMLKAVIDWYLEHYPDITILGHNQVAQKLCPCFSVPSWLEELGVPQKNIYKGDNYNVLKWHFKDGALNAI